MTTPALPPDIDATVARALAEDLGSGDLTASLVPAETICQAEIRLREPAVVCGTAWVDAVFSRLDPTIKVEWLARDGDRCAADSVVCTISGHARGILSGERTALNLLQTLSGTATITAQYCRAIDGTGARILDTRKTVPGLRLAQKYAVRCGGGSNHRIGLFDAILIKENHIAAFDGVTAAVDAARLAGHAVMIEVEVESMAEAVAALSTEADRLLLDEFSLQDLREVVRLRSESSEHRIELEASGNVTLDNVRDIAATGVDFVSIGALTKHVTAVDFSLRIL